VFLTKNLDDIINILNDYRKELLEDEQWKMYILYKD
jgi:hypothetical protein